MIAERSPETIERFVSRFVDRRTPSLFDEITVLPLDYEGAEDELPLEDWEGFPIAGLDAAIEFGLTRPWRAFTIYMSASEAAHTGCLLCFTKSGEVIVGVAVDDPFNEPEALRTATDVMDELVRLLGGGRGWVVSETPPPLDPGRDRPWESDYVLARS